MKILKMILFTLTITMIIVSCLSSCTGGMHARDLQSNSDDVTSYTYGQNGEGFQLPEVDTSNIIYKNLEEPITLEIGHAAGSSTQTRRGIMEFVITNAIVYDSLDEAGIPRDKTKLDNNLVSKNARFVLLVLNGTNIDSLPDGNHHNLSGLISLLDKSDIASQANHPDLVARDIYVEKQPSDEYNQYGTFDLDIGTQASFRVGFLVPEEVIAKGNLVAKIGINAQSAQYVELTIEQGEE